MSIKGRILITLMMLNEPALAQSLVPATSEDLAEFDRAVARQVKEEKAPEKSKSAFGAAVSEEAKKLKDASVDERKAFGKWVSSQRKKTDQGRPSAEGSLGDKGKSSSRRMDNGKNKKK